MKTVSLTVAATLAANAFVSAHAATPCATLESNKNTGVVLIDGIFNKKDPSYVDKYIGSPYIQHSRTIKDGADDDSKVEIDAVIADGDLVWINTRYSGVPNTNTTVGIDVYRFADGKAVEHWDILQTEVPVEKTVSGRPMFPIQGKVSTSPVAYSDDCDSSNPVLEANKKTTKAFLDGVFNKKDASVLDKYVGSEYLQHNPSVPDGTAALKGIIPMLANTSKVEFGAIAASADLVFVNTHYSGGGQATSVGLDAGPSGICWIERYRENKACYP